MQLKFGINRGFNVYNYDDVQQNVHETLHLWRDLILNFESKIIRMHDIHNFHVILISVRPFRIW